MHATEHETTCAVIVLHASPWRHDASSVSALSLIPDENFVRDGWSP